jgi:protein SCO1/2
MTPDTTQLRRRTVLRGAALAGIAGIAGCQSADGDREDPAGSETDPTTATTTSDPAPANTRLEPPENWSNLRESDVPYPVYGDELPAATVQAPLEDRELSTQAFVGERVTLLTFVYTRCGSICPALTANLVQVQADAADRGYGDDVALFPMTFDPAHDHAEQLREFGNQRGADLDANNWHFLRPASEQRVQEVVVETFGHSFQENPGDGMPFLHNPLLILANEDGHVERGYANTVPDPTTVIQDVRTLVEA